MTIYINEEDKKLFEQNGFNQQSVGDTVNHYRSMGMSDDEIQGKINQRLEGWRTPAVPKQKVNTEYTYPNQDLSGIENNPAAQREFKRNVDNIYNIPQVPMPPRNSAGYTNSDGVTVQNPPNVLQNGINAVKQIPQALDTVNNIKNQIQQPVVNAGRAIARPLLPKGIENNFLGSQEDEALLKQFDGVQFPSHDELLAQYKGGKISKDAYIQTLKDKLAVENARLDKNFRDWRNAEIGKEALLLGLSALTGGTATAGGGALATTGTAASQLPRLAQLGNLVKAAAATGAKEGAKFGAKYGVGASLIDKNSNPITEPMKDAIDFGVAGAVLNPLLQGGAGAIIGANRAFGITNKLGEAAQKAAEAIKNAPKEFQSRTNPNNYTKETVYEKNPFNNTFEPKERWQYKPQETPEPRNITPEPKQIAAKNSIAEVAPKTVAKMEQNKPNFELVKPETIEQGATSFSALPQNIVKNNSDVQGPKQYKVVNGRTVKVEPSEEIEKIAPKTTKKIQEEKQAAEISGENIRVGLDENGDLQHYDISDPKNIKKVGEPIYNESTHINKELPKSQDLIEKIAAEGFDKAEVKALFDKMENGDYILNDRLLPKIQAKLYKDKEKGISNTFDELESFYQNFRQKRKEKLATQNNAIENIAPNTAAKIEKQKTISKLPSHKYEVKIGKDGNVSDGLYMEGNKFHTDGNAAYLKEFVNADTTKVSRTTNAPEKTEQTMLEKFDTTAKYTRKLEDIGKGIVTPARRGIPKETWRIFKAGEFEDGQPNYVVVNDKYLLDKKDLELFADNENLRAPISIRKNGQQIGIVMPIANVDTAGMVDIKPIKTTEKSKPQEPKETISKKETVEEPAVEETQATAEKTSEVEKDINVRSKTAEPKKKESKKLDDAGEFLQGNRKLDTSLTWNDLKDMNDLIRAKNTTKARVYPKPSIEDLKSEGFSEFQSGIILNVYNKINAKPAAGYDKIEHQKQYVDTINEVMSGIKDYIKSHSDEFTTDLIADAAKKARSWSYDYNKSLFDVVFPDTENKKAGSYSNIFRLYPEYNRKAIIVGGNKFTGALQLDSRTLVDVMKVIDEAKKTKSLTEKVKKEDWEKNFIVLEPDRWNKEYAVANKNNKNILARYATKEEAIAAAKRVHEKIEKIKAEGKKANFERDYIERRENNKDVTTEELQKAFGFRGVNFGNWATAKERQDFANYAYDSLFDLAELLNLPPKAISLNGQLGLAYGAQGHGGKAAAHYIPAFKDINLTKEYGAGSLAHEWWHALDNYFANQANGKEFSEDFALSLTKGGELRPELYEALENLQTQIKKSPFTEEDIKQNAERLTARYEKNIHYYAENIKSSYGKAKNADELLKIVDDLVMNKEKYKGYSIEQLQEIENKFFKLLPENRDTMTNRGEFGWLLHSIRRLSEIDELAIKGAKKSEYLQNAEKIDSQSKGKAYWSLDTELGARAFSSYIFDRMEKQDILNKFLVRGDDGAVLNMNAFKELAEGEEKESAFIPTVPTNPAERERIFSAFDKLFDTIKTRETDKGVELYDIEIPSWMNDYKYTAKGYKDIDLETLNSLINKGCTQDELLSALPSDLHSAFRNIQGYKFYNFRTDDKGIHYGGKIKQIGINLSKVGNNPRKFVDTLMHEVEHADQEAYYNYLKNKDNLTPNEAEFIKAYKKSNRLNRVIMQYLKDNKLIISKVVNPFLKKNANLTEEEFFQNINNIKNKLKRDIIKKHIKYIDKYWDLFREVGARESGKNYSEVYIDEERNYDGRRIEKSNTHIQSSSADRNIGAAIRSRFRGNDGNLSIEGYRGEVNKNTSDEINQVVRDKVYDWHGDLESDRYDVDKALNSFVQLTKSRAKNISAKIGVKVSDKQLREIMPFLRERTGFPKSLDRDDLREIFNKLSGEDKADLAKFADEVSNKFEKYYTNYKESNGEQTEESIENHISHIWDLDDKKKSLLTNYITTNSKFAKKRTIGTFVEGIDGIEINGEKVQFKPKTLDYAEILKSSSDNLIKATHDSILANEIKNLKYKGEPLVLPAAKAPSEWIEVNHPALNKAVYMGSVGEKDIPLMMKNPVKVHPEIADYVSAIFEVQKVSKFWNTFDSLNGMVKQALLGFSGFHGYALSESSIGNVGVGKTLKELNPAKFVDAIKNGNYDVYKNEETAKRAIRAGVQLGTPSDLQRNLVEDTLKKVPYLGKYLAGGVSVNNKVLWDILHNNFKVIMFDTAVKDLGENITKEQERGIAQWVNDSFGGQAWELLGIKKSTIKAASRVLLSPDWNFSTIRQAAAIINSEWADNLINQNPKGKRIAQVLGIGGESGSKGVRGGLGRSFFVRSAIFFTVFYNLINAAFREKDRKEHPDLYPDEMTPKDYSIWANAYPMDNIYDRLMPKVFIGRNSDGTSRMLRVGKQFREVPEFITEPITKLGGKTSPLLNIASQVGLGMGVGDAVKRLNGGEAYLNQDIWNGYGPDAEMREGMDLAKGRVKAFAKSLTPFMASKYIGGKHEASAWDFFAQTNSGGSKSKVYKQTKEALKAGKPEAIEEIERMAYQDGLSIKDIQKMIKYAKKDYQTENTKKYKRKLADSFAAGDEKEYERIRKTMTKKHLSDEEQRRIRDNALKEYLKNNKN